jgi:hypothetical protein
MLEAGTIILGCLLLIGLISLTALIHRAFRPWRSIAAAGVGASAGGLMAFFVLARFSDQYLDIFLSALNALGLKNVAAVIPNFLEVFVIISLPLFTSMALGAYFTSLLFKHCSRRQKDDQTA